MKNTLILILLTLSLLSTTQASEEKQVMKSVDGTLLHAGKIENGLVIDELKGKILFVEIYGHRCPYCIKEIDPLNALQEKYGKRLAIVAVEVGGYNGSKLKDFDELYGIDYINISQKEAGGLVSYVSRIGNYRGMIPFLAIFDRSGKFYRSFSGPVPEQKLEKIIEELSKQPK